MKSGKTDFSTKDIIASKFTGEVFARGVEEKVIKKNKNNSPCGNRKIG